MALRRDAIVKKKSKVRSQIEEVVLSFPVLLLQSDF